MKTLKTLKTIAAVVAVSFSASALSAIQVPGLPTGYTFDNGKLITEVGAGETAIAGMNTIVESFGSTGGTTLLQPDFWAAFIGDPNSPQTFFNYAAAKPAIEELVYTVEGKTFHAETPGVGTVNSQTYDWLPETSVWQSRTVPGNTFSDAGFRLSAGFSITSEYEAAGYHEGTRIGGIDWLNTDSVVSNGTVQLGDLDQKGLASRSILTTLGFLSGVQTPKLTGGSTVATDYDSMYVTRTDGQIKNAVDSNSASLIADAADAEVNIHAYSNAVNLLRSIAAANMEENVLDVDKATKALAGLIDHHNKFLSSSIRVEAMKLKQIMQNNAYLTAASILGQSSFEQCANQLETGIFDSVCTAHGAGFETINAKIGTDAGSIVANNDALAALSAFVTNLVDFDSTSSAYIAAESADTINSEFSTIVVAEGIAQGSIASWSDTFALDFEGFEATFELKTVLDSGVILTETAEFK